ncbi:MAG TPA: phosphate ABC transporter permease subunit PstC [bacterium]|nr:phosphate ABC transporter permease subunit PstC [bacterium]
MSYAVPAGRGASPPLPAVPRSGGRRRGDAIFRITLTAFGVAVVVLVAAIAAVLAAAAMPSIRRFGPTFLWSSRWDPVHNVFGALPFIFGTTASSALALVIAVPISLGVAVYLVEIAPARTSLALSFVVELLAAVPSVILGLWGIFVLAPWVRSTVEPALSAGLGWLPVFSGPRYGVGLLAAGIILAIMIIPIISSVSRDVLRAVPGEQREAMYALGATRWEVISRAVIPYGRAGIIGAVILGLGRALGETMAVTMVIGNRPQIAASLFQPAYTIAAVLANEFTEATSDLYLSALIEIALVLFALSLLVNAAARWLVARVTSGVRVRL